MKTWLFLFLALFCVHTTAYSDSISTMTNMEKRSDGTSVHLSLPLTKTLDLRIGFNFYLVHNATTVGGAVHTDIDKLALNVKYKVDNYDILLDWFPFNNYFRVTGGIMFSDIATTTLTKTTWHGDAPEINGVASEIVSNDRRAITPSPYIGLGLGIPNGRSYKQGLSIDAGILFQQPPRVTLRSGTCTTTHNKCHQMNDTIALQKQQIDQSFSYRRYVMARIGLTYRF
jgi:hypothetical protein